MLNIAESSSGFSSRDRRHFIGIARGSAFECVAIMEYLFDSGEITSNDYYSSFKRPEEISKMLFVMTENMRIKSVSLRGRNTL
ncbi:MAG TPA: four helix bundle protein [Bacteroidetes bacterium]|nr:four helix bundle protein [Bacteroidota bacterium]